MIVSTALLRVCLSVRQQWFGSLLYVAVTFPCWCPTLPLSLLTASPHRTVPFLPFFFFSSSPTLSRVRRQKHGALLTGSDRFPSTVSSPFLYLATWTLSSHRKWNSCVAPGVALSLLMHCVLLFRLWWGDSDLLVAQYLVSCPTLFALLNFCPPPAIPICPTCSALPTVG